MAEIDALVWSANHLTDIIYVVEGSTDARGLLSVEAMSILQNFKELSRNDKLTPWGRLPDPADLADSYVLWIAEVGADDWNESLRREYAKWACSVVVIAPALVGAAIRLIKAKQEQQQAQSEYDAIRIELKTKSAAKARKDASK